MTVGQRVGPTRRLALVHRPSRKLPGVVAGLQRNDRSTPRVRACGKELWTTSPSTFSDLLDCAFRQTFGAALERWRPRNPPQSLNLSLSLHLVNRYRAELRCQSWQVR